MEYGVGMAWGLMTGAAQLLFLDACFARRPEFGRRVPLLLLACLPALLPLPAVGKQGLAAALLVLLGLNLYRGSPLLKALLALTGCVLAALLDNIFVLGAAQLLGLTAKELAGETLVFWGAGTAAKLAECLLALLVRWLHPAGRWAAIPRQRLLLTLTYPAASLVIVGILAPFAQRTAAQGAAVVAVCEVLCVANGFGLYLLHLMERDAQARQEQIALRQQLQAQAGSLAALEAACREQRRFAHDFQRHVQTVGALLDQNETAQAREYLARLGETHAIHAPRVNTHHAVIDAILNQKYQAGREKGVDLQFSVNDLSTVRLPPDQLAVLLANLLDNAIEASLRCEGERMVLCKLVCGEELLLSVRNTSPPVELVGDGAATTKPEPENHGFGLGIVRHILRGWGGEYVMDYADGWFQFTATMPVAAP